MRFIFRYPAPEAPQELKGVFSVRLCGIRKKKKDEIGEIDEWSAENGGGRGRTLERNDPKREDKTRVREALPGMNKWAKEKRKEKTPLNRFSTN